MQTLLRAALVNSRVVRPELTILEREISEKKLNDPASDLQVLIITYDLGPLGLYLHEACNCIILTAPGINWTQEARAAGRCLWVGFMEKLSEEARH